MSFHNDRSATQKNSKHTLSKRHIFFALNVIKTLQVYYTKVDNREATERLRCFYLQSKIAIMLVLIMNQKRTHTTSTVITALLEMSEHFEKNNVQQEPDSFIYLLFSNSSKHMYVGETVNIDVRMRQHLNMSRKSLPTLSAYKICAPWV